MRDVYLGKICPEISWLAFSTFLWVQSRFYQRGSTNCKFRVLLLCLLFWKLTNHIQLRNDENSELHEFKKILWNKFYKTRFYRTATSVQNGPFSGQCDKKFDQMNFLILFCIFSNWKIVIVNINLENVVYIYSAFKVHHFVIQLLVLQFT